MIINGKQVDQIVITREGKGRLTTEDGQHEVIAILSDDGEWIVKNGYNVVISPVTANECCEVSSYLKQREEVIGSLESSC